jgi:hypothetical protein
MLSGLTGDGNKAAPRAKSETTSTISTTSATSIARESMSAELRFASVNWDRERRKPVVDPRRSVDVPLTAQDKFRAVPWDPAEQVLPDPVFTEEDMASAEQRSEQLSVNNFFKKINW